MRDIKINKDKIGKNKPCYIVAELSGNHGGNFNEILKLIKLAKDAGANAIKLQAYTPDTITLNSKKKEQTSLEQLLHKGRRQEIEC